MWTNGVTLGDLTAALPYVSFAYDGLDRRINKSMRLVSLPPHTGISDPRPSGR